MKKTLFIIFLISVLIFSSPITASASNSELQDYINDFSSILPEGSDINTDTDDLISSVGFDALLNELISALSGAGGEIVSFLLMLFGLSLVFSFTELSADLFDPRLAPAMRAGAAAVATLLIAARLIPLVNEIGESLRELSSFFGKLIPIVTGISASLGAVGSAGVQALNMNITLSVLGAVGGELLLPLVFTMLAFSLVGSLGDGSFSALSSLVRSVFFWILGIVNTVLVASISLQSLIAGAADSASVRALKYAVSGTVPIVGATVSGALSTVGGALSYTAMTIGVGSVALILSLAVSPLVLLLLYRLALSLAVSFLGFLGAPASGACIGSFRAALDALIAVYVMSIVVYIIEIAVFMKSGVNFLG